MASVHLARQLGAGGFARIVAIKRLHERLAWDPSLVAMFLDEARLVARIRHPNVVQTLDVVAERCEASDGGTSPRGELFIVVEYVHGAALAHLVPWAKRGGGAAPRIAAAIMAGVLRGLHEAHERFWASSLSGSRRAPPPDSPRCREHGRSPHGRGDDVVPHDFIAVVGHRERAHGSSVPGGNGPRGGRTLFMGACFDVALCMTRGQAATVEPASCTIAKPAADDTKLNVALRVADDGICNADRSECYVVLDRALLDGWQLLGDRVQLPHAVCDRLASGRIREVVTTATCATKTEADNVCGCWSGVGKSCVIDAPHRDGDGGSDTDAGVHERFTLVTAPLTTPRDGVAGATLSGHEILIVGGYNAVDGYLKSAEIYDADKGTFTPTGSMASAHLWGSRRDDASFPVLSDGRVLVAGGMSASGVLTASAELYDPKTGTFGPTGSMLFPAIVYGPVALADSSWLFIGGFDNAIPGAGPSWGYTGNGSNRAQRYVPATGAFTDAGTLTPRVLGCNALTPLGRVQAIGGLQNNFAPEQSIDEYDPVANVWTKVGDLLPGFECGATYRLPDGTLFLVGDSPTVHGGVVYNPVAHTTVETTGGAANWFAPMSAMLPNGDILAFGGTIDGKATTKAQILHVPTRSWIDTGSLAVPRKRASLVLPLPNGDIFIAGGENEDGPIGSAELYHP